MSLDADAVAAEMRVIHECERAEREALRVEQEKEFEEAQAIDRQRQAEEQKRREELAREKATAASRHDAPDAGTSETAPGVDGRPLRRENPKVGRNDPCVCGSGKKYKQCCGKLS